VHAARGQLVPNRELVGDVVVERQGDDRLGARGRGEKRPGDEERDDEPQRFCW
jgi:hypothetical protein